MTQEQLDFLRGSRWSAHGEAFMFHRQADLDVYAARQAEIDRLNAESASELDRLNRQMEEGRRNIDAELDRLR